MSIKFRAETVRRKESVVKLSIFKLNNVKIPHNKGTASHVPEKMPVPSTVVIPLSMHIGAPAVAAVKAGDEVRVGTLIGEPGGFVSSPIYSSVSGKVKKIEDFLLSNGSYVPAVVIATDGEQTEIEDKQPPRLESFEDFVAAAKNSGVVGLGGAGFPLHVKLGVKDISKLEYVVINCAECEGYITSDTRTMLDKTDELFDGVEILRRFYGDKRFVIGIEDNKRECIARLKPYCQKHNVELKLLPAVYPMGGEKVLVYYATGRVIPEGKLPLDVGAIVINCTTLTSLQNYIRNGNVLTHKVVTVAGSAVADPKNVIVPIGASIRDVIAFCGGYKEEPKKLIYGGTMMGIAVPNDDAPILKNTNAILAFGAKEAKTPEPSECINCGRCVNHCPMSLMPTMINIAYAKKDAEQLARLKVNICMECGCCSYVCPANRPLVQTNKLSKAVLRAASQKK